MSDNLTVFGGDFTGVNGIKVKGTGNGTLTYIRPQGTKSITENGTSIDVSGYASVDVAVSGGGSNLQAKTNISPSTSSQTITPDSGYDGLSSVQINAMPSMTLPTSASSTSSGTRKATISSSTSTQYINVPTGYNGSAAYYQLSAPSAMTLPTSASSTNSGTLKATIGRSTSNQYINIPTGYNSSAAYYTISAVANGTEGTPTASKSTVSNHQVSVTPSVTNSAGYISGGTKTGTAVTVTAAELASGNLALTANTNSTSCVGYSTVSVAVPIVTYYTSSSNPTSSQGNNNDIWLVTTS